MEDGLDDDDIRQIFRKTRHVAVVGASNKPERPSFGVMAFLIQKGFDVTPVNPVIVGQQVLGRTVVGSLGEIGSLRLEMVDIFRAPDAVGAVVDDAVRLGARTVWMQLGMAEQAAAGWARKAGLAVVMDRCPKLEWPRLRLEKGRA